MTMYEQWENEPNYLTGRFYGLDCVIIRNDHFGNLCGYVAVGPGHPAYGLRYNKEHPILDNIRVHGGLTYSENHLPIISALDDGTKWWFGFDCAHYSDLIPQINEFYRLHLGKEMPGKYRDVEYVKREVENLAKQLAGHVSEKKKTKSKPALLVRLKVIPKLREV